MFSFLNATAGRDALYGTGSHRTLMRLLALEEICILHSTLDAEKANERSPMHTPSLSSVSTEQDSSVFADNLVGLGFL